VKVAAPRRDLRELLQCSLQVVRDLRSQIVGVAAEEFSVPVLWVDFLDPIFCSKAQGAVTMFVAPESHI
jgi:hypothetical protein